MAENDAKKLLDALKAKGDEALTADGGYAFKSTGYFKRNESIPEIGWENEILRLAFNLSKDKPYADSVVKGRSGYYVIRLQDRRLPDMKEYDKEKESIRETLLSQKKFRAMKTWLEQVKNNSEITIQEGFLD